MLGERPTIADISMAGYVYYPEETGVDWTAYPHLSAWRERILCSTPEREAFRRLLALGLADAFRLFEQPERSFSWWDYRAMGFRRNQGLRIDHILLSTALAAGCRACIIDKAPRRLERPSDHAPVIAELP